MSVDARFSCSCEQNATRGVDSDVAAVTVGVRGETPDEEELSSVSTESRRPSFSKILSVKSTELMRGIPRKLPTR